MSEVYIAATRTDGSVAHMAFQMVGRFPSQPFGGWEQMPDLSWRRNASDANIEMELLRQERVWASDKENPVFLVSWRRISDDEHRLFNENRHHRDALKDDGKTISHDMDKAREIHRNLLRHQRGEKFAALDAKWMQAAAKGDKRAAADVDAKRQALRDVTDDPRIAAARTIDDLLQVTL